MDNSTYRRNVLKTLSVKPAKLGLKLVAKKTPRTNVMHAITGISTEVSELVTGLSPYISGASKLTEEMKINAFEEMGDIAWYMTVAAKFLKVKLPGSGKKVKLKGMTRTEALLKMVEVSGDLLSLTKKCFYGPVLEDKPGSRTKKVFDIGEDGKKLTTFKTVEESVVVQTINTEKTDKLFAEREQQMAAKIEELAHVYWPLVFDLFEVPPSNVFVGNIAKLEKRYGKGFFELSEAEERDTEGETEAMTSAAVKKAA